MFRDCNHCCNDVLIGPGTARLVYKNKLGEAVGSCWISPRDIPLLLGSGLVWRIARMGDGPRAFAVTKVEGRTKTIVLPRFLLGAGDGLVVDHINGDPLDNRRENLRVVTQSINRQNMRGPQSNNSTGRLGVHRRGKGFGSIITVAGKRIYLGKFNTADEAEAAYQAARAKYFAPIPAVPPI